jgi:hypothetical protein
MKARLRELLAEQRFAEIAELAAERRRALGILVSLTFDADPVIAWRSVEAIGVASDRVAGENKATVRNLLRRLHWLLSEECGGYCPLAPQAMAEIVRRRPTEFSEYTGIVVTLLQSMAQEDLVHFRPAVLWAIGRLAPVASKEIEWVLAGIEAALDDPDPQVRGMAVWCLLQAGKRDLLKGRADLTSDDGVVELYEDGKLSQTSVGALLRQQGHAH